MSDLMTPEYFKERMGGLDNDLDTECAHYEMDKAMCDLLEQLGYGDGVQVFRDAHKWYA